MSENVKSVEKQPQICLNCKKTDEKEKYYEIFDEVGVQLKLNELLLKYFQLKIEKSISIKDQVICEQCLDKLTLALDEDEYNKEKEKNRAAEDKKTLPNTNKVVVIKSTNNDKGNKSKEKIAKTPKKATVSKEEKIIDNPKNEDKHDDIEEMLQQVLANNSTTGTLVVEQTESNEGTSVFVVSEEGNDGLDVANFDDFPVVADVVDDVKVIVDDTEILFDDVEKVNTEDETISFKTKNGIEYVISGGGVGGDDDDGENSEVIHAEETYEDFERIEDCTNEEGSQDGIESCTLIPFLKEDDNQVLDITSFLDEAIKSNLMTIKFSWSTECHICSWDCKSVQSLVAHVYRKHSITNNLYACPAKDCAQQLEGKKLFTRHLILNHGPLNDLLIYGSCPDCGLTFSNFMVFNRHSCARMIKKRRGMRMHCKLCEINFSSMKRYVFHMQFHLEKHRPKVCLICNYKSNDIEELFEHINYEHELQDVYPCRICDRSFKDKQNLLDHKHSNSARFSCKTCNRSYHFKASLMGHIKSSHAPALQCDLCSKEFSNEANYRYHRKSHMNTSTAFHACSNCGLISADRDRMLEHVNTSGSYCFGVEIEDEVVSVAYSCEFCLVDFKSKNDLKLHRSTGVHADGKFICIPCKKSFANMKLFRSHRRHVTSQWKRENIHYLFMCNVDDCEESYTRWTSLYAHKRRHHNVAFENVTNLEEEPQKETRKENTNSFVCQFCDKDCPTKMSLAVHIARRHNNKNVECSVCNASFKNEELLNKHFNYLHVEIECSKCLKVVKNRRNYDVHVRVVHMAEKRYFCQICGKGFYHKTDKDIHEKLHEEIYICEICDFTTNYAKSLEIHSKIHWEEFDYECKLCKKKFSRKPALMTHLAKTCKKRFYCEKPKDVSCQKIFTSKGLLNRHLKYKHGDADQAVPTDHVEEGAPPPAKRSKRLHEKNNKNTNNVDDVDVNDSMNIVDQVCLNDENEIQNSNTIQYEIIDNEIEQLVDEFILNEEENKKEMTYELV